MRRWRVCRNSYIYKFIQTTLLGEKKQNKNATKSWPIDSLQPTSTSRPVAFLHATALRYIFSFNFHNDPLRLKLLLLLLFLTIPNYHKQQNWLANSRQNGINLWVPRAHYIKKNMRRWCWELISLPISSTICPWNWLPTFLGLLRAGRWCALGTVYIPGLDPTSTNGSCHMPVGILLLEEKRDLAFFPFRGPPGIPGFI